MTGQPIDEIRDFLLDPGHYGDQTRAVHCHETHFALLFLTDTEVYKLKKAVLWRSLDARELESRINYCQEELRLNSRLAPGVYIEMTRLTRARGGRLTLNGSGPTLECLVRMHRLPREQLLENLLEQGKAAGEEARALAQLLADFHADTSRLELAGDQYLQRLCDGLRDNLMELGRSGFGLPRELLGDLENAQLGWIQTNRALLRERARLGRVGEAHGDLRPEHIFLTRPPSIIDCLEFSRDLRLMDTAEEIAGLIFECRRLGAGQFADDLLREYVSASRDRLAQELIVFYASLRGVLRGKLTIWHLEDPEVAEARDWHGKTIGHLERALDLIQGC